MAGRARHPTHPALVHFPIACWILATLADLVGQFLALPPIPGIEWAGLAHLLLWGGVLLALPAVVAGIVDYLRLPDEVQSSAELNRHIMAMATAWLLFLGAAVWRMHSASFETSPSRGVALLELAGSACLLAGGRFAATIVFERMVFERMAGNERDQKSAVACSSATTSTGLSADDT